MAPHSKKPTTVVLRQQRIDVYNSTSTGHQVGSGVSKPAAWHRSRASKLQVQFCANPSLVLSAAQERSGNRKIVKKEKEEKEEEEGVVKIFAGCSVYVNGSTAPKISDVELKRLLCRHGARVSPMLWKTTTTHVVLSDGPGGGLAAGKLQREMMGKKLGNMKYVTVQW